MSNIRAKCRNPVISLCLYRLDFETNGDLPARSGYGPGFDLSTPEFGMMQVPRVAQYRGFIFASLAPRGDDFMQPALMRKCIDTIIECAPDEAIELAGVVHRYEFCGTARRRSRTSSTTTIRRSRTNRPSSLRAAKFQRSESEDTATAIFDDAGGVSGWHRAGYDLAWRFGVSLGLVAGVAQMLSGAGPDWRITRPVPA